MLPNLAEDGTEDALHSVEERVHLILDSATEGIFGCDAEGTCLFSNASAARMLGFSDPRELLAKNMPEKTARRIHSKNVQFLWVFKKVRASTETMRSSGERMARAFP
jgi:PAS domain-containing protein